jgi:hypothetical protein
MPNKPSFQTGIGPSSLRPPEGGANTSRLCLPLSSLPRLRVCFTSGYVRNQRSEGSQISLHFRSARVSGLQSAAPEVRGLCTQVKSAPCGDIRLRSRPRVCRTWPLSVTPVGGPGHSVQWPRCEG